MKFGLTLSSEEHEPQRLLAIAQLAEESGFDFVSISDHFHPWLDEQGHSPFVWTMLGALAERTERLDVVVGVTCPIMRIHPAILAQATATTSRLLGERFTWGVGTGEALNEHILGDKWPTAPQRLEMLEEAIEVIRELWRGDDVSFEGEFFTVEHARIYDAPLVDIPIVISAFGPNAAELAARCGEGLWTTGGASETIDQWKDAGGSGPVYSQISVCWNDDRGAALDTVQEVWRTAGVPGQLSQDLPTPAHFDMAASIVRPEDLAESVIVGADHDRLVDEVREAAKSGVDHLYFHQIGDDQETFCETWRTELADRVATAARSAQD
jgi:coenzyme F420-dependent glucose-6-phosphate dehydrogenase